MTSRAVAVRVLSVVVTLGCLATIGQSSEEGDSNVRVIASREAIARIEKLGGSIRTDERIPGESVVWVSLRRTDLTHEDLKAVSMLDNVQLLDLSFTDTTNAGLRELARLKKLRTLDLRATIVSDAGMNELAALPNLQSLDLSHPPPGYPRRVIPAHKIRESPRPLKCVDIFLFPVTDAGIKELARLRSLQSLDLSGTRVTDAGLKELAVLPKLQVLNLSRTAVSDAGLKHLKLYPRLQKLSLKDTNVTSAGAAKLKVASPNLSIDH